MSGAPLRDWVCEIRLVDGRGLLAAVNVFFFLECSNGKCLLVKQRESDNLNNKKQRESDGLFYLGLRDVLAGC